MGVHLRCLSYSWVSILREFTVTTCEHTLHFELLRNRHTLTEFSSPFRELAILERFLNKSENLGKETGLLGKVNSNNNQLYLNVQSSGRLLV